MTRGYTNAGLAARSGKAMVLEAFGLANAMSTATSIGVTYARLLTKATITG
jgi:hypothetical protein